MKDYLRKIGFDLESFKEKVLELDSPKKKVDYITKIDRDVWTVYCDVDNVLIEIKGLGYEEGKDGVLPSYLVKIIPLESRLLALQKLVPHTRLLWVTLPQTLAPRGILRILVQVHP